MAKSYTDIEQSKKLAEILPNRPDGKTLILIIKKYED